MKSVNTFFNIFLLTHKTRSGIVENMAEKNINVALPEPLHAKLRLWAEKNDTNLKRALVYLIETGIKRKLKR